MRPSRFAAVLVTSVALAVSGACTSDNSATNHHTSSTSSTASSGRPESSTRPGATDSTKPTTSTKPGLPGSETGSVPSSTPNTVQTSAPAGTEPLKPVRVGVDSHLLPDVDLRVSKVKSVKLTGRGPGDSTGPGIAVYVTMQNNSKTSIDFSTLSVVAQDPDGQPLIPSRSEPTSAPTGKVAPGDRSTAVWTFHLKGDPAGVLVQALHPQSRVIAQFRL